MNREVPRSRRLIAALLLVLLTGCQTWQPAMVAPRDLISEEAPSSVRVTKTGGDVVTIKDPIIRNDSIVSAEVGLGTVGIGVATADINALEVRRLNTGRTLAFVGVAVAIALGWTRAVTGSSGGTDPGPGPLPKG